MLPHAGSLVAAAREWPGFNFSASAESGVPQDAPASSLGSRFDELEAAMSKLAVGVKALLAKQGVSEASTCGLRVRASRPKKAASAPSLQPEAFTHLGPGVVQCALDCGASMRARKSDPLSESTRPES